MKKAYEMCTAILLYVARIAEGGGFPACGFVYDTRTIAPALLAFGHVGHVVESVSYRFYDMWKSSTPAASTNPAR